MWLLWSLCCLLQAKQKFIILCLITRLSVILQRSENVDLQEFEFLESSESFKLVSKFFLSFYFLDWETPQNTISNSTIVGRYVDHLLVDLFDLVRISNLLVNFLAGARMNVSILIKIAQHHRLRSSSLHFAMIFDYLFAGTERTTPGTRRSWLSRSSKQKLWCITIGERSWTF